MNMKALTQGNKKEQIKWLIIMACISFALSFFFVLIGGISADYTLFSILNWFSTVTMFFGIAVFVIAIVLIISEKPQSHERQPKSE